jgi:hypothetical protein
MKPLFDYFLDKPNHTLPVVGVWFGVDSFCAYVAHLLSLTGETPEMDAVMYLMRFATAAFVMVTAGVGCVGAIKKLIKNKNNGK